ncbi:Ubiquinone biosynthesis O-methyltransferase [Defluviimonas aquaemixtae]|uniref:Ubiquinone biosynthesis O-methyltransferase n=1 Tax=Albidovulum aquaemixtae TaxID=1542388 RepID=A0A2R8BN66_9RHOB|nr:class I SAM-dependent methyltransferase [Defluviimonas aquaemixtae]SPH24769.1 Ubiquinone biosynthesis O-methyltransferase [Defluviimonas aquaemixtae]
MDYHYTPPPVPTLARWRRLYRSHPGLSVLRVLEYEALAAQPLAGRVLDVGGGAKSPYVSHMSQGIEVESVNIDPKIEPTYLIEPGERFPVPEARYDHVICLNTLEHIYDAASVLKDIRRVLKPGGTAIVTVPWIFRIHAHPDDYFRATPSWWRESFERAGFSQLELQPLVWGRYTSASAISGHRGPFPRLMFHGAHLRDWLYALLTVRGGTYSGKRGERICAVSSGWMMIGEA